MKIDSQSSYLIDVKEDMILLTLDVFLNGYLAFLLDSSNKLKKYLYAGQGIDETPLSFTHKGSKAQVLNKGTTQSFFLFTPMA